MKLDDEYLSVGQDENGEAAIKRLRRMHDAAQELDSRIVQQIHRALPLGTLVNFYHGNHLQTGTVIGHSYILPEIRVENVATLTVRWIDLHKLFNDADRKTGANR